MNTKPIRRSLRHALSASLLLALITGTVYAGSTPGDLHAQDGHVLIGSSGLGVESVSASHTLNGYRSWFFTIDDQTLPVTDPTITVDSGYSPSLFPSGLGASSFPVAVTQASLKPGESFFSNPIANFGVTTIPVTMTPGFDSSRSVSPVVIHPGGGQQRVTISLTPVTQVGGYKVNVSGGAVLSGPTNLGAGEYVQVFGDTIVLGGAVAGKTYLFTFSVNVPNSSQSLIFSEPWVHINTHVADNVICCYGPSNSFTFADPTLDGGIPGRGQVTYSVNETVPSWSLSRDDSLEVGYPGLTLSANDCKKGGWRNFGIFKNQGDCVSFVATGGKNGPGCGKRR